MHFCEQPRFDSSDETSDSSEDDDDEMDESEDEDSTVEDSDEENERRSPQPRKKNVKQSEQKVATAVCA